MDALQEQFAAELSKHGLTLSARQAQQFEAYYQLLVEWNEKINLTAITERSEVYWKHFYDSISLAFYKDMNQVKTMADIGSGAGFPGIPLKIIFPDLKLTIVDSLNKRINFLNLLADTLELSNVNCVHGRAEDVARTPEHRDHYDLVTARAVARLSVLNEFCLPFVKPGGMFVAMKGSEVENEIEESSFSLRELSAKRVRIDRMELPVVEGIRHFVHITKTAPTAKKYPRKAGTPLKQPLIK
ncbi:16S rRNA (guanine(527)-N(7))-methyltransferase RsmG [Paenibacillus albiflavus]|nr:16S rRNA (guanine(527)-N(7))-methyltransferase RsmG [Paenibacillus albiflavus]